VIVPAENQSIPTEAIALEELNAKISKQRYEALMQKKLRKLVGSIAREQVQRLLGKLVDARVFIEVNQGEDRVKEEWR